MNIKLVVLLLAFVALVPTSESSLLHDLFGYEAEDDEYNGEEEDDLEERGSSRGFTITPTGCPCWFNMSMQTECACCKTRGIQCGYPMHNQCKGDDRSYIKRTGCKGVPMYKDTLSGTGYPCFWDPTDYSCPWCSFGSKLCVRGLGSPLDKKYPYGYCVPAHSRSQCVGLG